MIPCCIEWRRQHRLEANYLLRCMAHDTDERRDANNAVLVNRMHRSTMTINETCRAVGQLETAAVATSLPGSVTHTGSNWNLELGYMVGQTCGIASSPEPSVWIDDVHLGIHSHLVHGTACYFSLLTETACIEQRP